MREKAKALTNPLPETAGTISNTYFFRLLFVVSVESPLAPSLGHPLPHSCSPLFIPFTHSAGRGTRLRGCYTSAPMPGFLEGTGRAETMRGPEGLNVYGWVALAPPLTRRWFGSLQPAGPRGEGRCPCRVPAAWATSLCAAHRGLDGAAGGRQCPAGAAQPPPGLPGAASSRPSGVEPLPGTPGDRG